MTDRLLELVPGIFGLFFIAFAVVEILEGKFYPARGGRIIVAARSPVSFWVTTSVELAGGIALIGVTWYRLRQRDDKKDGKR